MSYKSTHRKIVDRSPKKRIFLLCLLVLLPTLGIGFLTYKVAKNEQAALKQQWHRIMEAQLHDVDEQILARLDAIMKHVVHETSEISLDIDDLRALVRKEPFIKQILVLSPDHRQIHPPLDESISTPEAEFLERIKPIVSDLGKPAAGIEKNSTEVPSQVFTKFAYVSPKTTDFGFYVWFWKHGLDLIFWQRNPNGLLYAIEIDRSALLADLIEHLPEPANFAQTRIILYDEMGQPLYQLGKYHIHSKEQPKASMRLSFPLSAFKLDLFQSSDLGPSGIFNRANMNLFFSLGTLLLSLLGLAIYLYRDQNRLLRTAGQRVNFVNQVSHELKTPLTNIRMYAELLETELPEQEKKAHQYLHIIVAESQRLSRLIQNVLMFARNEKTKVLHFRSENLASLTKKVLEDFAPAFHQKDIRVYFSAPSVPSINLDSDAMKQVIVNLLSNVEKYAAMGKEVRINITHNETAVFLRCQDLGPGIRPEFQEKIFEPFFRGSDSLTEGVSGTGIGLTLARNLVRMHGGELRLIPTSKGACFEIELPISKPLASSKITLPIILDGSQEKSDL